MRTKKIIEKIEKGDVVALIYDVYASERVDIDKNTFYKAELSASAPNTITGLQSKQLFGSSFGIYLGMKYKVIRNIVRNKDITLALHSFLFGDREVFINPEFVKVVLKFSDSLNEKEEQK